MILLHITSALIPVALAHEAVVGSFPLPQETRLVRQQVATAYIPQVLPDRLAQKGGRIAGWGTDCSRQGSNPGLYTHRYMITTSQLNGCSYTPVIHIGFHSPLLCSFITLEHASRLRMHAAMQLNGTEVIEF